MKLETDKQEFLTRYLLGQLSESESARLEDSSFSDHEQLEELRAAENDLIDEYVRGELPADQMSSFEKLFLASPQRRQRIEFAVALDRVSSNAQATESVHQRMGGALTWRDSLPSIFQRPLPALVYVSVAIMVTILIGAWLWSIKSDQSQQIAQSDTPVSSPPAGNIPTPVPSPQPPGQVQPGGPATGSVPTQSDTPRDTISGSGSSRQSPGSVATFVLPAGLSRSESERTRLIIPSGRNLVILKLDLEKRDASRYRSFAAELQRANGEPVWKSGLLKIRGSGELILKVPVSVLVPDAADYELTLKGRQDNLSNLEPVGFYYLHIIKE